jgi:shikimate dehydrogenase
VNHYLVLGNPIAHSRSPFIQRAFAAQTGQVLSYELKLVAIGQFEKALDQLREDPNFMGCNITVPFKLDALDYARRHDAQISDRALLAGAVNTLKFDGARVWADNTDGIGLVTDLEVRQGLTLRGLRVVLLGAGGAARGVLLPLLDAGVGRLVVANRDLEKAQALVDTIRRDAPQHCGKIEASVLALALSGGGDVLINATSASLASSPAKDLNRVNTSHTQNGAMVSDNSLLEQLNASSPEHESFLKNLTLAYDMQYGAKTTSFMIWASQLGCPRVCDGLGMLVEQAAQSFELWRGVRPQSGSVFDALRAQLSAVVPAAPTT